MGARQPVIGAFERDYTAYDANGNLTAFTDLRTAANDAYGYDPLNRLVTADGTFGSQAFGYDRNANRLSWLDNATTTTYDYAPGSNRLVREGTATVTLDANGNITAQGQRAYTHSPDNRIVSVRESGTLVATYAYNALGQRVAKTVGGATTRFIYGQNGELLAETDATGAVLREYIYLNGTPLAVLDSSGVHYLHTDHLGTPRAATDQSGTLVWRWISDPFGTSAANDDPDGDGTTFTLNLRFTGQYFDAETGLHYNYFRYYDPDSGRYVTSDPIGLAGGLNTYGYVGGNPANAIDPTGQFLVFYAAYKLIAEPETLPTIPQEVVDAVAGFGDTLSFGVTDWVRDQMGTNSSVNKCSGAYSAGEWAGIGLSLGFGGAHLLRNAFYQTGKRGLGQGFRRLFSDGRTWNSVRDTWSRAAGGGQRWLSRNGQSLHHWLIPQRAGTINAGFNYLPISAGFNSWMNGSTALRTTTERALRLVIGGIYGAPVTAGLINEGCGCER